MPFALIIAGFVLCDLLLLWSILSFIFRRLWRSFAADFPARSVIQPSVYRAFQSFAVNSMNLGKCVHVTLDDECLHLCPAKMLRWMGLTEVSVPWEAIFYEGPKPLAEPHRFLPNVVLVRIGKNKVLGPRWCFEMILRDSDENRTNYSDSASKSKG